MTKLVFRPAVKDDCRSIAELYSISSDGVADYIWTRLATPGQDILDVGQARYERENTPFSYQSCTLATVAGEVAGMMVAFPMWVQEGAEEEDDPVLAPFSKLEEDASYYVCGVALFPAFRNRGIGGRFMQMAEEDARGQGLDKLSLIVFEQNESARRLYERLGYREVDRAETAPHALLHYSGAALLMVKAL